MAAADRKKALVTGASRGIGRAVASALAAFGYDLYMTCRRNTGALEGLAEELRAQYGTKCRCYTFPIHDEGKVAEMFRDILIWTCSSTMRAYRISGC